MDSNDPRLTSLRVVREAERKQITGVSKSLWWQHVNAGNAPRPIKIGPIASGWIEGELYQWILGRMAARDSAA